MLQLSKNGVALIHDSESFRAVAYLDSKRIPTIGYGTTRIKGVPVKLGMTCTEEQALEWFNDDCREVLNTIERRVQPSLNQHQIDALASFIYNVGGGAFANSTLLKAINEKMPVQESHFTRWNKIRDPQTGELVVLKGLTKRRLREYALYVSAESY
jgi:lysozyme